MSDPLETKTSTLAFECCICGSPTTIMGHQALSQQAGNGTTVRVRFHSTCYLLQPKKALDELNKLLEQNK